MCKVTYLLFFAFTACANTSNKSTIIQSFADTKAADPSVSIDQNIAAYIVDGQQSRIKDAWGSGQFGAQRDKGERTHKGLDIVAKVDDNVYAPFDGDIVREAVPYKDDNSYRGIVIKGSGDWIGYEMKIFYVEGLLSGGVTKGQTIGKAQNLNIRYPNITNHIHVEVRRNGQLIDPFEIWQMSF